MSTAIAEVTEVTSGLSADGQQYLTFDLAEEHYGVDILKVQEIKGYTAVTKIPNTPEYLKGVLNLRGTIVPIVDLRLKFGMGMTQPTAFTVIVVVNVCKRVMGFLVDAVSDVLEFANKDIQPPPELGSTVDITFVSGIGSCNDRLVTLLDIDRVLIDTEVAAVTAASQEQGEQ
ncbi:MAG: chemotaxis protein CheW [Nitrospirales bacterium]|nr:purine-binding chemotaxis protein CheW [Nitrospira sp.]MDR4502300.1 chemotaxis protein CheW [Nitrospirales bacterium]